MVVKSYVDEFDPNYYMNKYPDVKNAYGTNTCDLFTHYQNFGISEGRFPSYNLEKQSELDNPTFSQNYLQFNDYRIKSQTGTTELKNKEFNNSDECRQYCNDLDDCAGFHRNVNSKKCHFFGGLIYPDTGLEYMGNRNTFIREKINNTVCDAECKRNKKLKTLEEKYQRSLYNYNNAPDKLKTAKKNYIIYKDGDAYYQEIYEKELTKKINGTVTKLFEENKSKVDKITNSINDFKQKYSLYKNHLNNYLDDIDKNNKAFEKKLYNVTTEKELDARKSYYENKETENIIWYSSFFTVIYYILFVMYLVLFIYNGIFGATETARFNVRNVLWILLLLCLPYIWYYIFIKYLIVIFNFIYSRLPKDVYYDI